ncbi:MAG: prepilin-type N-terminal cleavage/methylation domain-containing protein [Proteobacteria bacterium]|nr:prepilin-type N-terminal cleavage/methylation domain-containing protein [Pseudomonadota bacterium]MBU1388657.1 prepilin-type N-terminal cleavage/methylation domain-containing protein [Pseudomonadota bacterium]MBU1544874.1 prepilin-type N-terminal cleavage/methylation domain-containing protein [Pseudomonadota bacterium]MBU2431701.1 prepilin-type N-terminal cleavage/methylation domain-containing protein [Pseudomonadota bacterium]MBU2479460.1 prepilin-type N-terminal cleavage/methylation domain
MNKAQKGFTLLEVMITIMVFSLVMVMLYSSFRAFLSSSGKIKTQVLSREKTAAFSRRIHQDLESVFIVSKPRYAVPEFNSEPDDFRLVGIQENLNQKTVSSVFFASLAHADITGDGRQGVARIAYYLRPNDEESFDLCRFDTLQPFGDQTKTCHDPVLFSGVTDFEITYMDAEGESHLFWDSESKETDLSFPASMTFKLSAGTLSSPESIEITVALPVTRSIPL